MIVYKPVQEPDGFWIYKKQVGSLAFPVGWCVLKDCRHQTPEEASDCYKKYLIEERGSCLPGGQYVEKFEFGTNFEFSSAY